MNLKNILIATLCLFFSIQFVAQKKNLTIEDCELGYYKGLYPESLTAIDWTQTEGMFSYFRGDSIVYQDLKGQQNFLSKEEFLKVDSTIKRLPKLNWISNIEAYYRNGNAYFSYSKMKNKSSKILDIPKNASNTDYYSPKNLLAYTVDNNLYVAMEGKPSIAVFKTADKNIVSGQAIHRFEFGISKGTFWSPKGNALAFYQKDETDVADYPLLDINTTPGSLKSVKYPMAGQKSEYGKVGIYNVASGKVIFLKTEGERDHYLTNLAWSPDEQFIFLAEVNRDQNHMWLNQYNAATGQKVKTLFEEENKEWTEPEHPVEFIPGSNNEFLWFSERDGFMNLYHYNTDGKLIKQLTNFKWVVQSIVGFSIDNKKVYIEGTGEDPKENHCYEIEIASKKVRKLTSTSGVHHCQLSPDGKYLLDSWSSLTVPNQVDIIDVKKVTAKTIHKAENPLKEYSVAQVEFLKLKSKDGFDLECRMMKPSNFDATKKYPVLVYVYGGPHAQLVTNDWLGGARLWMHYVAEQGYIVFTLDGRGSSNRGYDFEKEIHRNLGTAEMEDQMIGVEYLKSLPYVNADRMAVHGWSFGGFMTTSLMTRYPGVFTTGVAGGPVIDWKWYEIMYGERYMDRPEQNPKGYETASLLNYVKNLKGKLLMIHGTVDDVVVMQHNLAYVQKCVTEGVQIDFFPYPMHEHNVRGKDRVHLMTKIIEYILRENQ